MISIMDMDSGEYFDLPDNLKLSIELNNPLVEEQGDFTLPITLPVSDKNIRLLKFPFHFTSVNFKTISVNVIVDIGVSQMIGVMKSVGRSMVDGITMSVIFNASSLYTKVADVDMDECFSVVWDDFAGFSDKVSKWVTRLQDVMIGKNTNYPFAVFPVLGKTGNGDDVILNQQDEANEITDAVFGKYYGLFALTARDVTQSDDTVISYPIGYNVTPFLYLSWVLRKVMEYFGFSLSENKFDTDVSLKKIVILNNTCDAVLSGKIYSSHLIPEISVTDFFDSIRYNFGCDFFVNTLTNEVQIVFWDDILSVTECEDFTSKISSKPLITDVEYQTLKLTKDHQTYEDLTGANYSTYQKFNKTFNPITYKREYEDIPSETRYCFFFNQLMFIDSGEVRLAYDSFDFYDEDAGLTSKELNAKDTDVSMEFRTVGSVNYGNSFFPFISDIRNKVSHIEVGDDSSSETGECKLIFCFSKGRHSGVRDGGSGLPQRYFWGSTHMYDFDGNSDSQVNNLNLVYHGDNGLFNTFFSKYDASLRKGMHLLNFGLNMNSSEIKNYSFKAPVLVDGVRLLPSKLQYEVSATDIKVVNAYFLMI